MTADTVTDLPTDPGTGTGETAAEEKRQRAKLESAALNELLSPVRWSLRIGTGIQVLASAATVAPYIALAMLTAAVMADPLDAPGVRAAVLVGVGGLGAAALLTTIALQITHLADARLMAVLRRRMIEVIGRAPLRWFSERSSGRVRKALESDLHDLHYLVAHGRVDVAGAMATPLFALGAAYLIEWRLGLVATLSLPVYGLVYGHMMRGSDVKLVEMDRSLAEVSARITEMVDGITVVKAFGRTGKAHRAFSAAADAFGTFFAGWVRPMLRIDAVTSMLIAPATVLTITVGAGLLMHHAGWIAVSDLLAVAVIATVVPQAVQTAGSAMYARQTAGQAAKRVHEVLATAPLPDGTATAPVSGDVVVDQVTFGYQPDEPVLHQVSLRVRRGTITALVGPSGSGKSTLASLVARFADPDQGSVSIGGVDLRELTSDALYRSVGFMLQDPALMSTSVADNIRLARPGATDDEVCDVAVRAQIHHVIEALPRGYDSVVGDDARLSSGERQRVCIARTLLADPAVLVLDEATSFLDPEAEAEVQAAITEAAAGRTVIVIAHRLRTIRHCHQIAVLDHGHVVETGTHDELVRAAGPYARLWRHSGDDTTGDTTHDTKGT